MPCSENNVLVSDILPKQPVICALDAENVDGARRLYRQLRKTLSTYKIGQSLFIRTGLSDLLHEITDDDNQLFLDAKLNDTPHTIIAGLRAHFDVGATWSTAMAHALASLDLSLSGAEEGIPEVVGVAALTSALTSAPLPALARRILFMRAIKDSPALRYLVAAPTDPMRQLREEFPDRGLHFFCPGVVLDTETSERRDHNEGSVATVEHAAKNGADAVIVGRLLMRHRDPSDLAKRMVNQFNRGKGG